MRRDRWALLAGAFGGSLIAASLIPSALGGFEVSVGGPSRVGTGVVADTVDSSCSAAGPTGGTTVCPTSASLLASPGASRDFPVADTGTLHATIGISASSCGVATVGDTGTAAETSVVMGDVALSDYGQDDGPLAGSAMQFSSSTGFISTDGAASASPTSYTELAWFDAAPGQGGALLGFANADPATNASVSDPQLWIDSAGNLVTGVLGGSSDEVESAGSVSDGSWHLAAVTLSGSSLSLYVDGTLQQTDASVSGTSSIDGWWSVGAATFSTPTWSDPPTLSGATSYFDGALAGVAVLPSALDAAQISSLYGASNFASYSSLVDSYTPLDSWTLQDAAPTVVTRLAGDGGADACTGVLATVTSSVAGVATCLLPSAPTGTSCPAASGGDPLNDLVSAPAVAPAPIAPGTTATITIDVADAAGVASALAGADVVADLVVTASDGSWKIQTSFPGSVTAL